jgi:hypothetical protein
MLRDAFFQGALQRSGVNPHSNVSAFAAGQMLQYCQLAFGALPFPLNLVAPNRLTELYSFRIVYFECCHSGLQPRPIACLCSEENVERRIFLGEIIDVGGQMLGLADTIQGDPYMFLHPRNPPLLYLLLPGTERSPAPVNHHKSSTMFRAIIPSPFLSAEWAIHSEQAEGAQIIRYSSTSSAWASL